MQRLTPVPPRRLLVMLAGLLAFVHAGIDPARAAESQLKTGDRPALVAIIIDDLGDQLQAGRRAITLPGAVTFAVIPHTAYGARLASEAHRAGKEVMLHFPMQPMQMERIAGPGEISLDNGPPELLRILDSNLAAVPYAVGINNHMGSLITRHPGHMRWLMQAIKARGDLYFVDSMTTASSVAYAMALEGGVPAARRHVFLDDDPSAPAVARQFRRLLSEAGKRGFAIGIGHPYPTTLDVLDAGLAEIARDASIELVPASRIVALLERGELRREAGIGRAINIALLGDKGSTR